MDSRPTDMDPSQISIEAFDYSLPDERIAKYPLAKRDHSKLLVFRDGQMTEHVFHKLPNQLPADSLLVFNNTKVIHARLHFTLESGRKLEILCLEPLFPIDYQQNLSAQKAVVWKCLIGGNRKWKSGVITQVIATDLGPVTLTAERIERLDGPFSVRFHWNQESISFGELLAAGGIIPLPPYLNRDSEITDKDRYQTIYAQPEGSVAAPTAGLHFTENVFQALTQKNIRRSFVTLHVGAGTFKPVTAESLGEHEMHRESICVDLPFIQLLAEQLTDKRSVIAVGTTSLRTLESLYWLGVRFLDNQATSLQQWTIDQWEPYQERDDLPKAALAIRALAKAMKTQGFSTIEGYTQLLIAPGYKSQLISGIITNFHQPRSTLLLLVAALIGDNWRAVYNFALDNDFRFLSYGDSSLLWKAK